MNLLPLKVLLGLALLPLATGRLIVTYQDALMTHLPAKAATVEQLRAGVFPFLNPYASCGQPLAGNPNFGTFFPDMLFFLVLPLHVAFGLRFALAFLLGFVGARRWARAEGASRPAADLAGFAFVLSGVFVSAWRFFNSGLALGVAPWVLAAVARLLRRGEALGDGARLRRAGAEVGLWMGLELVAGEPVVVLFTLALMAGRALTWWAVQPDRRSALRPLGILVLGLAVAGLLAGPQVATTLQSFEGSSRDRAPFTFPIATSMSVHPVRFLEQVLPFPFGRPDLTGPHGFRGHRYFDNHTPYLWTLHVGLGTLVLLAVFGRPRARAERFWWASAALAVLLSLGYHLPFARVLHPLLSLGGRVRFPVKWWYVVALCLVPLVATAAGRWLAGNRGTDRSRALLVVVGLALLFTLADLPLLLTFLDRPPAAPVGLAGGRVYERLRIEVHPRPESAPLSEARTREVFRRTMPELWAISGGVRGIPYAYDRDPDGSYLEEDRVWRKVVDDLPWPERAEALRRAGVRYVVTDEALASPYLAVSPLGRGLGVRLYALDGAVPPVRFVPGVPSGVAALEDIAEEVHRLRVRVVTPVDGVLVWSRTGFPAWRVRVDGRPADLEIADHHLVGIPLPAGTHEVEVDWPREPLILGAAAWVLGMVSLALLRRERRP